MPLIRSARFQMSICVLGLWGSSLSAHAQPATPSPVAQSRLEITTRNGSCEIEGQIEPGAGAYTGVTFTNEAPEPHQVQIVALQPGAQPSDLTPDAIASALAAEPGTDPIVSSFLGGPGAIQTGGTEEVILELPAEDDASALAAICSIPGQDDQAIVQPFPSERPSGQGQPPEADATVTLTDSVIDMRVMISGGTQLWKVINAGSQPHDLVLVVISPTMSEQSIQSYMQENGGALPENVAAGGMRVLSPGTSGWFQFDLPPGQYLAICDLEGASRAFSVSG